MNCLKIEYKALALIMSTLFFSYAHFGWGYENKFNVDLPLIDEDGNIVFKALAIWLLAWANFSRFEFVGTKWVKPITCCFYVSISYAWAEIFGTASGHFSVYSVLPILAVIIFIGQRENIKWYLKKKDHKILYTIFGIILTYN